MKNGTEFTKTIFCNSKQNVKRFLIYPFKCNLYLYFIIYLMLLIFRETTLMSTELKGCVTWFIHFLDLIYVRYNCTKFHQCRICATDFWEGRPFCPPPPAAHSILEQPQKCPSWIELNVTLILTCLQLIKTCLNTKGSLLRCSKF